ncbi:unnamed protein product [Rotaria sp. Silwood1]|nr:unnamed protein product [Rotaria sp. Silwood1]
MQQYRFLLLIIVFTTGSSEIFGQQYEWSGNYQWSDDECNQTQCCCPHGTLSVISNDTSIGFISNLRGRDCEKETFNIWAPYPRDLIEVLGRLLDTSNCDSKATKIHDNSSGTTVTITKFQSIISTASLMPASVTTISVKLKQEYEKQLNNERTELYRGQLMSKEEVETLKKARYDHFIYINSFFSTTPDRDLALNIFAGAGQTGSDERKQSVLFELKIDKEKTKKVYANTQHLSSVPDENETLFTVGTIFHKYGDVQYDEVQHVSIVQLQLISDKEAQDLCSGGYFTSEYDRIGNATSIYAQFIKVGYLLQKYTQNNFDSVKKYYTLFYQLSPLICHAGLGYVTSETREFDLAWAHQDEALRIYKSSKGLHDSPEIEFLIYDCLGQSFRRRKMWDLALECYTNIARIGFNFFLLGRSATLHRYFDIAQECEQDGQSQLASDLLAKLKLADPNYYSKIIQEALQEA